MKKIFSVLLITVFFTTSLFSQVLNNSQIINPNHWIYQDIYTLSHELCITNFSSDTPVSAGELKLYFSQFDRDKLSDSGKIVYDRAEDFLYSDANLFNSKDFQANFGIKLAPELNYKTNENIPWNYHYYYKDNPITASLNTGIADYFSAGTEIFFGKNYKESAKHNSYTNIPLNYDQIEYLFPRFAYGSIGIVREGWGADLMAGK